MNHKNGENGSMKKIFQEDSKVLITTSHNSTEKAVQVAKKLSFEYGIPYYNRRHLNEKIREENIDFYYVVDNNLNLSIRIGNSRLFFHPGISKIRMENFKREGKDYLLDAIRPSQEDIIYDATFGLGMDAIFMAHFVKKIVGTEVSTHIYRIVSHGLKNYDSKEEWINNAIKKIDLYNEDMKKFISKQPAKAFDIVYCDPMFENPIYKSSSLNPIRPFANYDSIDDDIVEKLLRIARKRVVIKSLERDRLLDKLSTKFDRIILSRKNGLIFACIDLDVDKEDK
ncbi:MAG TPA: class I SAM-dependent methyltransferase [Fervidobacterium sp.]|nr:class I SAM-dependent methyltransferase [Fervidobacterium sp.]HPT54062.1 class I SAM-dependent methyltransferase [Fervidobacterium sp.]HQE48252.1 class I SAM-dependent methyltransferase [Fervidobacterium sp.]